MFFPQSCREVSRLEETYTKSAPELQRKPIEQKEADSNRGRKKPNEDKRMEYEMVQTQSQGLRGSFFCLRA
jgi:hypothetical protein